MSTSFFQKLHLNTEHISPVALCYGNGEKNLVTEVTHAITNFEGHKIPLEFKISDHLPYNVLLGINFILNFRLNIRVVSSTEVIIESTLLSDVLPVNSIEVDQVDKVFAIGEHVVPPRSTQIIPVHCPNLLHGCVLVEPNLGADFSTLEGVVYFIDHQSQLLISNYSLAPVLVHNDATVGYIDYNEEKRRIKNSELNFEQSPNINLNLSVEQQQALFKLIQDNKDIFASSLKDLTQTHLMEAKIELVEGSKPPFFRPYKTSQIEDQVIEKQIQEMLEAGIISSCHSDFASPVLVVKKKSGGWRVVNDFRALNKITKYRDHHPLPLIEEILSKLGGAKFFTTCDLFSGYYQIPLRDQDKDKTGFLVKNGHYRFEVMPQGIANAPADFVKLMGMTLRDVRNFSMAYLDDILIFSTTFEEHLSHLRQVFDAVREVNLKLQLKKCHFAESSLTFLGHVISDKGIQPDNEKIKAILDFPVPSDVSSVRSFLGLTGYYRKFVEHYATIATPLHDLLQKDTPFNWTSDCQSAFETLKSRLVSAPILCHFDNNLPIVLHCDASNRGLGAVCSHFINKEEHPFSYFSRSLNKQERNYSISEKEILAVLFAIAKARPYIFQKRFRVVTDHRALTYLLGLKDLDGRLCRWQLRLNMYVPQMEIIHRAGKGHHNADALSRAPLPYSLPTTKDSDLDDDDVYAFNLEEEQFRTCQKHDAFCQRMKELKNCKYELNDNGVLCRQIKISQHEKVKLVPALPKLLLSSVLIQAHDPPHSGHRGLTGTYEKICNRYFYPKLLEEVRHYISTCDECQRRKPSNQKTASELAHLPTSHIPNEYVCCDIIGPIMKTAGGKLHILVTVDIATRWVETRAIRTPSTDITIGALLEMIVYRHGLPGHFITDRGSNFTSYIFQELMARLEIKHNMSSAWNSRANGLIERVNRTLRTALSIFCYRNPAQWDLMLPAITFGINTSVNEITKKTPFELIYARRPILPLDRMFGKLEGDDYLKRTFKEIHRVKYEVEKMRKEAQERIEIMQKKHEHTHNKHFAPPCQLNIGDKVLVRKKVFNPHIPIKMQTQWKGPYIIVERMASLPFTFRVRRESPSSQSKEKIETINGRNLRKYNERKPPEVPQPTERTNRKPYTEKEDTAELVSGSGQMLYRIITRPQNGFETPDAGHEHPEVPASGEAAAGERRYPVRERRQATNSNFHYY